MLIPRSVLHLYELAGDNAGKWDYGQVRFERDEGNRAVAVATNGPTMLVAGWWVDPTDDPNFVPVGLPPFACRAMLDATARLPVGSALRLTCQNANANDVWSLAVNWNDTEIDVRTCSSKGRFPPWRKIADPARLAEEVQPLALDAVLFARALTIADKVLGVPDSFANVKTTKDTKDGPWHFSGCSSDGRTLDCWLMGLS